MRCAVHADFGGHYDPVVASLRLGGRSCRRSVGRTAISVVLATVMVVVTPLVVLAAPGDLDRTFGGAGLVTTRFSVLHSPPNVAVQPAAGST